MIPQLSLAILCVFVTLLGVLLAVQVSNERESLRQRGWNFVVYGAILMATAGVFAVGRLSMSLPGTATAESWWISMLRGDGAAVLIMPTLLLFGLSSMVYGASVWLPAMTAAAGVRETAEKLERAIARNAVLESERSMTLDGLSHAIRTPLATIDGYARTIVEDKNVDRNARQHAIAIARNADSLESLLDDVIDLTQAKTGDLPLALEIVSPWRLLTHVLKSMRVRAEARGLQLDLDVRSALPDGILTDARRLRRALSNLVENALESGATGRIVLSVHCDRGVAAGPRMTFAVHDRGQGMDRKEVRAALEGRGTEGQIGLGLPVARTYAEMLGGTVRLESEPQRGTTASLTIDPGPLDAARWTNDAPSMIEAPLTSRRAEPPSIQGRILIADDGLDTRHLLSHLATLSGASVETAQDGLDALERIRAAMSRGTPFDVVVADVRMPRVDGLELTRRLRSAGDQTPIIAISADTSRSNRENARAAGCDDFLSKPCDRHDLIETLAWALGQSAADHYPVGTVKPAAAAPATAETGRKAA